MWFQLETCWTSFKTTKSVLKIFEARCKPRGVLISTRVTGATLAVRKRG